MIMLNVWMTMQRRYRYFTKDTFFNSTPSPIGSSTNWLPWSLENRRRMEITDQSTMVPDIETSQVKFWNDVLPNLQPILEIPSTTDSTSKGISLVSLDIFVQVQRLK